MLKNPLAYPQWQKCQKEISVFIVFSLITEKTKKLKIITTKTPHTQDLIETESDSLKRERCSVSLSTPNGQLHQPALNLKCLLQPTQSHCTNLLGLLEQNISLGRPYMFLIPVVEERILAVDGKIGFDRYKFFFICVSDCYTVF